MYGARYPLQGEEGGDREGGEDPCAPLSVPSAAHRVRGGDRSEGDDEPAGDDQPERSDHFRMIGNRAGTPDGVRVAPSRVGNHATRTGMTRVRPVTASPTPVPTVST